MKNISIRISRSISGLIALGMMSIASLAYADVTPVVTLTVHDGVHGSVSGVLINTGVHANISVASSTGPVVLGTVDVMSFQNMTCSGASTTQSALLLASGQAESATTTVGSSGLSYKVNFNGQSGTYTVAQSSCIPVTVTSTSTIISLNLSTTSTVTGVSVFGSSSLSGGTSNATGTVDYKVFTDNTCSVNYVTAGSKTVANAVVPNSDSITFNTIGTYYWNAKYSGDQNNNSATSSCKSLAVYATSSTPIPPPLPPTPPPVSTTGNGLLSGISFNDTNFNLKRDSGEVGISGFVINLYGGNFWWNFGRSNNFLRSTVTDSNGMYTFGSLPDGFYRIEEVKLNGWKQLSSDFRWVFVWNSSQLTSLNFANTSVGSATSSKATTTPVYKNRGQAKKAEKMLQKSIKKQEKELKKLEKSLNKKNKNKSGDNEDDD